MIFFFPLVLFVILILTTLTGVGLGYLLHWMLPIGLDSAIIAGAIFSYMAISLTVKLVTSMGQKEYEDDDNEIFVPIESLGRMTRPYVRKKRKK